MGNYKDLVLCNRKSWFIKVANLENPQELLFRNLEASTRVGLFETWKLYRTQSFRLVFFFFEVIQTRCWAVSWGWEGSHGLTDAMRWPLPTIDRIEGNDLLDAHI